MYAVSQIQRVKDGIVLVYLPNDFPSDLAEVIILPTQRTDHISWSPDAPGEAKVAESIQRILSLDISHFDEEQFNAYQRTCEILHKGRKSNDPRIFGAFEGLIQIADDFNTLPDEYLDLFDAGITVADGKGAEQQP